jgi:hypothetical protein
MDSVLSPNSPYIPLGIAALVFISFGLLGWIALRSARDQAARHREGVALYRRAIEASEAGQRLQSEANSLMRELITELRAARQTPEPPQPNPEISGGAAAQPTSP